MSFGSVFASIGTKIGMDPVTASIIGGGYDAISDYLSLIHISETTRPY